MKFFEKKDIAQSAGLDKVRLSFLAGLIIRLFKLGEVNKLYTESLAEEPVNFVDNVLFNLESELELVDNDLERFPNEGAFICVANHPFGFIDGLIMIKLMLEARADSKVMANYILTKVNPLKEVIIPVNPFEEGGEYSSFAGLKATLKQLNEGHPVGLFPAGEVSTKYPDSMKVEDREWQESAIKIIRKSKVPVVPMYFAGQNSAMFHLLGKIHPRLRTAKIPSEILKRRHKKLAVRIGNPIPVSEIEAFEDDVALGRFLRAKTYSIGTEIHLKSYFRPNLATVKKPQPIVPAIQPEILSDELKVLPEDSLILEQGDFQVYITKTSDIPNILNEIGRLRELTFREVGEGSNRSIDLDQYDSYYLHLFIWDKKERRIAGAYRIGMGDSIMVEHGKKGFYTQSLFRFKNEFEPILKRTIELGRSFVVKEYQTKPLPLFILWRGILHFLIQNPRFRYIIGPVTISNQYSGMSKWMIIEFIKRHFYNEDLAQRVKARTEFEVKRKDRDLKLLDAINFDDIKALDKLIAEIEPSGARVPVLLKKYLKQNAKIIAFNIDPQFNNALDGLMILDMEDLPQGTIDKLKMEMKKESQSLTKDQGS